MPINVSEEPDNKIGDIMNEEDESNGTPYKHISTEEMGYVNECSTSDEANREVGFILINELRELNYQLYQLQKSVRE